MFLPPDEAPPGGDVPFAPLQSATTYLIDRAGRAVHTWGSDCPPGASQYLLDNGHLLRCGRQVDAAGFSGGGGAPEIEADFAHANSVAYNPHLDQIVLSVNQYHEVWIIDHATSSAEAASHAGGRRGRGGDLLYRWGNPRAYGRGTSAHQLLFAQHDARWIPPGFPGAGHLTVLNNGDGRPGGDFSSVLELAPPLGADGRYEIGCGGRYGPEKPTWEYAATPPGSFAAAFLSGAQRLASGNTLISAGSQGRVFEVSPKGTTVREYSNPYSGDQPNPHGDPRHALFWATHVPADHPGLAGRSLAPLDPQPPRSR